MDAAQLVEQRKAGKITQEEFFIALNQLRRANISFSTKPSSREAPASKSALDSGDGKPCENVKVTNPEAGGDRASQSIGDGVERVDVTTSSGVDGSSPSGSCRGTTNNKNMPQNTSEPMPSGIHHHLDDAGGGSARLKTFHDLNAVRTSSDLTDSISAPKTVYYRRELLPPGKFAKGDQLVDDSEWLVSPRGETEIFFQRRSRKTSESCSTCDRGCKRVTANTLYGEPAASYVALSPQRTNARVVESWTPKPRWRPAGGYTPLSYGEVVGSHCNRSSAARSWYSLRNRSRNNTNTKMTPAKVMATQRATVEGDARSARLDGNEDGHRRNEDSGCPRSARRERSLLTTSPSQDEKKGVLAPEASRRTSVSIKEIVGTSPVLDNTSVHSLHGGYDSSRTGYLYRGRNGQTSLTARGHPSHRESLFSLDFGQYYTRARVDRYGYPLHEKEKDLVSTGVAGNRAEPLFAPMIKGLPDFYRARPKRALEFSKGGSGFTTEECYSGQPISLYERTMDWKTRAGELRAHRLAQREEMEIADCTFQPNVPRRRPNATSSRTADTARSTPHNASEEGGERGSSGKDHGEGTSGPGKGRETVAVVASQRLFEESKRLKDRRSEGQERKKMWEEETFARSYTFQPSLMRVAGSRSLNVRARYMDPPTTPAGPMEEALDHSLTFRPKIKGVKPGMIRAIEYVSVDVAERLHRARPINSQPFKSFGPPDGLMSSEDGRVASSPEISKTEHQCRRPRHCGDAEDSVGEVLTSPQSEKCYRRWGSCLSLERQPGGPFYRHHDARRQGNWVEDFRGSQYDRGGGFCFQQRQSREGRMCSSFGGNIAERESSSFIEAAESSSKHARCHSRPHSAPASSTGRGGVRSDWQGLPRVEQSTIDRRSNGGGEGVSGAWGGGEEVVWQERNVMEEVSMARGDGRRSANRPSGRQAAISFQEFLVRQTRSQAAAGQRLSRLKTLHSPSFTPQLSRGSRQLAARHGPSAGGGTFKERLDFTKLRRSRDQKAAISEAMAKQKKACTFSPRLTLRSRLARSRSARERSIGSSVLKAAKQRMVRAREDIRLLDGPGAGTFTFTPKLATIGNALAPQTSSRLRLAAELDTYLERVQDAAIQRDEEIFERRRRAVAEEGRACTFRPELSECPELVRRTAAGMRCIREFRKKEASSSTKQVPAPKPEWR